MPRTGRKPSVEHDWQAQANEVYNRSAGHFSATFQNDGARIEDIQRALEIAGNPKHARALEIGCGTGRDATEIIKRVDWFEGSEPAADLVAIARQGNPTAKFVVAGAADYQLPLNLDAVFAFTSLLHVSRTDMPTVFHKVAAALRPGGIFYINLREQTDMLRKFKKISLASACSITTIRRY